MLANPKAVLWDYDGTLVDTEPIWTRIEQGILREHDTSFTPEQVESMRGQSAWLTARMIAEAIGRPDEFVEVHRDLHERVTDYIVGHDLPFLTGARELMAELDELAVPAAIVTSSNRQVVEAALSRLPRTVRFIVTADDVAQPKPDPEGYLQAMNRLGVAPDEVVVLEDSVPGTAAGLAAGAVVYAVPGGEAPPPHPRLHINPTGLAGVTFEELARTWRTLREQA